MGAPSLFSRLWSLQSPGLQNVTGSYLLPQLSVKSCASVEGRRGGGCMCKATGQKPRRWRCDMQYNVPVNNTYINICTIKSILVNNTAEDANTNKQTNKVKQKHPD